MGIDDNPELKEELRDLEGVIPESINRRDFFKASVATVASGMVAGCQGNGDPGQTGTPTSTPTESNDTGTDTGGDFLQRKVTWRNPWQLNLSYPVAHITALQGFWVDQNITPPTPLRGFGSGDTTNRVANAVEVMGMSAVVPQVSGLAQGYDFKIFGTDKARTHYGMLYREDRMSSATDLEDKTVLIISGLSEQMWAVFEQEVDIPDSVDLQFVDDQAANSLLAEGQADAVWRGVYRYPEIDAILPDDVELGVEPLYNIVPTAGFTTIANGSWLEESGNIEYTTRVLQGYSRALKWIFLHPEETVDIMRNDVNDALQTQDREDQLETLKAGVIATNLTEPVRENGLCYLDRDAINSTLENTAIALGERDEDEEPLKAEDVCEFEIQDNAELATLTSDEWDQVTEFATPYSSWFEG